MEYSGSIVGCVGRLEELGWLFSLEGQVAAKAGLVEIDNPYPEGSFQWLHWREGWHSFDQVGRVASGSGVMALAVHAM